MIYSWAVGMAGQMHSSRGKSNNTHQQQSGVRDLDLAEPELRADTYQDTCTHGKMSVGPAAVVAEATRLHCHVYGLGETSDAGDQADLVTDNGQAAALLLLLQIACSWQMADAGHGLTDNMMSSISYYDYTANSTALL